MSKSRGKPSQTNRDHGAARKPAGSSDKRHRLSVAAVLCPLLAVVAFTLFELFPSSPQDMVWIPGGEYQMGDPDTTFADAQPVHKVYVDGFWMDRTEVTNAQFLRFVDATGYVTVAERQPD